MSAGLNVLRLAELRAKTDRQLLEVVAGGLDQGLNFARLAEAHLGLGDFVLAELRFRKAAVQCEESGRLLPWLSVAGEDRRRLEAKHSLLRSKVDELSPYFALRVKTAC
jgi:hypothetical protein